MRNRIEKIGYYLSYILFFNMIYALSIIADGKEFKKCNGHYRVAGITTLVIVCIFVLLGLCFTLRILRLNDAKNNTVSTGKQFKVLSVKNLTGENYFSNFTVIVLTGIALPSNPNWCVLAIFLLIEFTLGIVYIKQNMFYMNPVLPLLNYNIFECTGEDAVTGEKYKGVYYFVTKELKITQGEVIKYKNINSHIIWIKNYMTTFQCEEGE